MCVYIYIYIYEYIHTGPTSSTARLTGNCAKPYRSRRRCRPTRRWRGCVRPCMRRSRARKSTASSAPSPCIVRRVPGAWVRHTLGRGCTCVCVYVCLYVCIYVCMYVCMHVCVCVYVCTHTCSHMHVYMHLYVLSKHYARTSSRHQ